MPTTKTATKTAPKTKAVEKNKDVQALLKAIGTGDTDGVDTEKLNELMDALGLAVVAKGTDGQSGSRIEKVRKWLTASELDEEETAVLSGLVEVIGSAPIITGEDDLRDFSTAETDLIVEELDHLRPTQDLAKGRIEALRATVFNILSLRKGDDFATGEIPSLKNGRKVVVGIQNKTPDADLNDLKGLLDDETWESITVEVTERVVSESLVAEAMAAGKITMTHLAAITPEPNLVRTMTVKDIKKGDPV